MKFFLEIFAGFWKRQYLCIRFWVLRKFLKRHTDDIWKIYNTDKQYKKQASGFGLHGSRLVRCLGKKDNRQLRRFPQMMIRHSGQQVSSWQPRAKSCVCHAKDILLWRVWSWLRMNASSRLNTCKSRGSMKFACKLWWRPAHGWVTRIQPAPYPGIAQRKLD